MSCHRLQGYGPDVPLHVQGSGASPEGNKPFIDILEVDTGATQRIWQSKPPFYESTGAHATLEMAPTLTPCTIHM